MIITMRRIRQEQNGQGFTLPSVLAVSLMVFGLLVLAIQLATSASHAAKEQYYNQLAREAAEAGAVRAENCLRVNNNLAQWTNAKRLKTNTDCRGNIVTGYAAYVMRSGNIRTSFEVGEPARGSDATQRTPVFGRVEVTRPGGSMFKTYLHSATTVMASNTLTSEVAFGYNGKRTCPLGGYFVLIDEAGMVKGAGQNGCGQLGVGPGIVSSTVGLRKFMLPAGKKPSKVFTSFGGEGRNVFVLTIDGEVYGAGYNEDGELGNGKNDFFRDWHGHIAEPVPQKFRMDNFPDDNKIVHVIPNGYVTFVITSKGNVYASGYSGNGGLGIGWNDETNWYKDLPVKVKIPAGEKVRVTDGAWATKSWTHDKYSSFIITESGKLYGWGDNSYGQLAQGDRRWRSLPTKVGTFGEGGKPKAKQVLFDGYVMYVLDEEGAVYSSGHNTFGQAGVRGFRLWNLATAQCLTAQGWSVKMQDCNSANATSQLWDFDHNGNLRVLSNPSNIGCY